MRVVIAPDSFKGTATATDAAAAIADGWRSVREGDELVLLPQADGGEGTLAAVAAALPDAVTHTVRVSGPDGRPIEAAWLRLPDGGALVELAQSSGLPQMARLDPLGASTRGLGEVLMDALDAGASRLTVALGGSASTDGGAGALAALGADVSEDGVDLRGVRPAPAGGVVLLTDVTSPLLGPDGAAAVFGPQKGASPADVAVLEQRLSRWAEQLGGEPNASGAGAAGGTAYGLATAWGASIRPGAEEIARLSGLTAAAPAADVLILGEGRFDGTSLAGKVAGHALGLAGATTEVVVIAGVADPPPLAREVRIVTLSELAGSAEAAQADALRWLQAAGARVAGGR